MENLQVEIRFFLFGVKFFFIRNESKLRAVLGDRYEEMLASIGWQHRCWLMVVDKRWLEEVGETAYLQLTGKTKAEVYQKFFAYCSDRGIACKNLNPDFSTHV